MKIGIDFDNTIVSYDALFHKIAVEKQLIPQAVPVNKVAVRNHLREIGQEDEWTALQGYVYGARLDEAIAYNGVLEFIRDAKLAGHTIAIMSHKTLYPFVGPQYNLHIAAKSWVTSHINKESTLISEQDTFFELTKKFKIERIARFGCDVFIDDLPEILLADEFPIETKKILFDPESHFAGQPKNEILRHTNWNDISRCLLAI